MINKRKNKLNVMITLKKEIDEARKIVKTILKSVKQDGVETIYTNGQKSAEIAIRDEKLNGPYIRWYETGEVKTKGAFKDGIPDGTWIVWYKNGQKQSEGKYQWNGEFFGKEWNSLGQLLQESSLDYSGKIKLQSTTWYANGQKQTECVYENGKLLSETEWDEVGNMVSGDGATDHLVYSRMKMKNTHKDSTKELEIASETHTLIDLVTEIDRGNNGNIPDVSINDNEDRIEDYI